MENQENRQNQIEQFLQTFQIKRKEIEFGLESVRKIENSKVSEIQTKLESIQNQFQKISKLFSEATIFLPAFEIKQIQQNLANLEKEINLQRSNSIPKQQFSFKSKRNNNSSTSSNPNNKSTNDEKENSTKNVKNGTEIGLIENSNNEVEIKEKTSETIEINEQRKMYFINKLIGCKVKLNASEGSVFIQNCKSSSFYISSQQVRIHWSEECDFYLEVKSKPIIENSTKLRFSPLQQTNQNEKQKETESTDNNKNESNNQWDKIEDFNWLKSNQSSPNFSIIDPQQRIPFK